MYLVPVLFTFYIQSVLKFTKIIPAPKGYKYIKIHSLSLAIIIKRYFIPNFTATCFDSYPTKTLSIVDNTFSKAQPEDESTETSRNM